MLRHIDRIRNFSDEFLYCLDTYTIRDKNCIGHCCTENNILDKIKIAYTAGWSAVELWHGDIISYIEKGGTTQEIKDKLEEYGLAVPSYKVIGGWMECSENEFKEVSFPKGKKLIEIASQINAESVILKMIDNSYKGYVPPIERIVYRYDQFLKVAEEFKIKASIEFMATASCYNTIDSCYDILERVDNPWACLVLDLYHLWRNDNQNFTNFEKTIYRLKAKQISVVHYSDVAKDVPRNQQRDHDRRMPGDGLLNLQKFVGLLRSIGYKGAISLNNYDQHLWNMNPNHVAKIGKTKLVNSIQKKICWGIIGSGNMAKKFATTIKAISNAELVAIASRSKEKANQFAKEYNLNYAFDTYDDLVKSNVVDAIYVSTPHVRHKDDTILCLNGKKAVLCEKPFAMNAHETIEMIEVAKRNNVFLMEAMWFRFLPIYKTINNWIPYIGKIKNVKANYSFCATDKKHFDINIGGGALLDVGVYTLSLANMIFKRMPDNINTTAVKDTIDRSVSIIMHYGDATAELKCSIVEQMPHDAFIIGEYGEIKIPSFWKASEAYKNDIKISSPFKLNGYEYEIQEATNCILANQLESKILPLSESLQIMKIVDEVKKQIYAYA